MSASQSASYNRADASASMEPKPLPQLPPGWKYAERWGGWGPYSIVEDRDFIGERAPKPESGPCLWT